MSADGFSTLLSNCALRLGAAGVESPRREARRLLAHALGVGQEDIIAGAALAPTAEMAARFEALLGRRVAREPLAYILGSREFWSLDFAVGPGVLIPRPESEILVDEALRRFPDRDAPLKAADLGTGSGCLLIAFLKERPNASGLGIDISQDALSFAARNAAALCLNTRASFIHGDWTKNLSRAFDAIFVNPPYIPSSDLDGLEPEIGRYEPRIALDGGRDGLDPYRRIAAELPRHLKPGGLAFFEVGQGQVQSVSAILVEQGLSIEGTLFDLAGIPRCLVAGGNHAKIAPKKQLALET